MKSQRPYLLRALHSWIVDSEEIPYLLVDATAPEVQVPLDHVQDGQIILNVGANAVLELHIGDEYVMFGSRFDGRHFDIVLPIESVRAIYCKDSGEGMVFPDETLAKPAGVESVLEGIQSVPVSDGEDEPPDPSDRPTLRLV
ncbi:MAG: ClpXP protease specificity-enhancing factor [Pseudomonadales bacterium]|nr:ClpXP protease specificity-enhancing factor [Pseudomonadales bacterium]